MSKELERLSKKLEERKMIKKAKGNLMQIENIIEEEAYQKIRNINVEKRVPMIKVAKLMVMSDE